MSASIVPHKIPTTPTNDFETLGLKTTEDDFFHDLSNLFVITAGGYWPMGDSFLLSRLSMFEAIAINARNSCAHD